jgi:hypothetical protein
MMAPVRRNTVTTWREAFLAALQQSKGRRADA